jgi:hypothetical protein
MFPSNQNAKFQERRHHTIDSDNIILLAVGLHFRILLSLCSLIKVNGYGNYGDVFINLTKLRKQVHLLFSDLKKGMTGLSINVSCN